MEPCKTCSAWLQSDTRSLEEKLECNSSFWFFLWSSPDSFCLLGLLIIAWLILPTVQARQETVELTSWTTPRLASPLRNKKCRWGGKVANCKPCAGFVARSSSSPACLSSLKSHCGMNMCITLACAAQHRWETSCVLWRAESTHHTSSPCDQKMLLQRRSFV